MTKRYGWIKLINMLLILVLLLAAVPQNVIAETVVDDLEGQLEATSIEPADDIGMTTADITELINRRERNIKHFQMPDGSVKMIVYGSDVHRKNAAGTWQNIDNRLTLSAGILGSRYTTSDARVSFARDLIDDDEQSLVTLQEDDYIPANGAISTDIEVPEVSCWAMICRLQSDPPVGVMVFMTAILFTMC